MKMLKVEKNKPGHTTHDSLLISPDKAFSDRAIQHQARIIFLKNVSDWKIFRNSDNSKL